MSPLARVASGVTRAVLHLYPPSFRRDAGDALLADVARFADEVVGPRGGVRVLIWLVRHTISLLVNAALEWGDELSGIGMVLGDLRIGLRSLGRNRGFTATALATLVVTIGITTAIFSVVDGVLWRPLPFPNDDALVIVRNGLRPGVTNSVDISFSDRGYWHFVQNNRVFEAFGGYRPGTIRGVLTGDGSPAQVKVVQMTGSLFRLLGTTPLHGRFPSAREDLPDGPPGVLLSYGLWSGRYGSDAEIIGRSVVLDALSRTVIGVMPRGYNFPSPEVDMWVPFRLNPASENFEGHHIEGLGRLRPGATLASASADAERLIGQYGEVGYGEDWFSDVFDGTATLTLLKDRIIGGSRRPLLILLGTIMCVLLIACTNVANLLLVRAESRTLESSIRMALGASRARLIQHAMTESLLISVLGGAGGLGVAFLATRALVAWAPPTLPRLNEVELGTTALVFAAIVSVSVGLLCGLLPALRHASQSTASLGEWRRRAVVGPQRNRARSLLVIAQVSLAFMLVVSAGLMVRSIQALQTVDPGFDASRVLTFRVQPAREKYETAERLAQFYEQLGDRLRSMPEAVAAGGITVLPLAGDGPTGAREIEEFPATEGEFPPVFGLRRVTPGYFAAMSIPIVEGRAFSNDDHRQPQSAIIITRSIKDRYWPDRSAIGKRISGATVVGVVGDVRGDGLDHDIDQVIYGPMIDSIGRGVRAMTLAVSTEGHPPDLVASVRRVVEDLDPDLPVTDVKVMSAVVANSIARTRYTMALLTLAAVVAVFLGLLGIYGMLSYVVTQRTPEIGIRLALGAAPSGVYGLFLVQGMTLAVYGVMIGLVGGLIVARGLRPLLYEVRIWDPLVLASGALAFLAIAAIATLLPALRAARIPPATAIRSS